MMLKKADEKKMNRRQSGLVDYLKCFCYGRTQAMKKNCLAAVLGMSTRELRQLKRSIVINFGVPIGSDRKGYYYATTEGEIRIFRNYYMSLAQEHLEMVGRYDEIRKRLNQPKIAGIK